ncbi:hypothetical protein BR93DRAFT_971567 [Coniochaeta sp. PMI_546]|nr:hypothetical protein BR93DRAFT_971567 [Coniochaeta sp. PMI_546]
MPRFAASNASATANTRASPVPVRFYSSAALATRQRQLARLSGQSLVNVQHPFASAQASSGLPSGSLVRVQHQLPCATSSRNATHSAVRARPFSVVSSTSTAVVDPDRSASAFATDDKTTKKRENTKTQKKSAFVAAATAAAVVVSATASAFLSSASPSSGCLSDAKAIEDLPGSSSSSGSGSGSGSGSSGTAVQHHPVLSSGPSSGPSVSLRSPSPIRPFPRFRPFGIKQAWASVLAAEEREEQLRLAREEASPKVDPGLLSPSPVKPSPKVGLVPRSSPSPLRPFSKAGPCPGIRYFYNRVVAAEEAAAAKAGVSSPEVTPRPVTPQPVKLSRVMPTCVSPPIVSPSPIRPAPISPSCFSPIPFRLNPILSARVSPPHLSLSPIRSLAISPVAARPVPVLPVPVSPPHLSLSPIRCVTISPLAARPVPKSLTPVSPRHISPPARPGPISPSDLSWRPPKRPIKVFPATAAEVIRQFREAKAAKLRSGVQEPALASVPEEPPAAQLQRPVSRFLCPRPSLIPVRSPARRPVRSPVRSPIQSPVRSPVPSPVRSPVPSPVWPPVRSPIQPLVQTPKATVPQTFAPGILKTMHLTWSSPNTSELYPSNVPSPSDSQLDLWRRLSKLPLDDQIAGRVLTPPPGPREPTPDPSHLVPSDVDLSDDLMDGSIPMYQLAAMMARARDGTPEPPSRPETPSILHGGITGYSLTPPRCWWKDEEPPPRKHPRKYMEDDSDFTYDFSRTVTPPEVTFQGRCSPGFQRSREKELERQVQELREALGMMNSPAVRPDSPVPWSSSPPATRPDSPVPWSPPPSPPATRPGSPVPWSQSPTPRPLSPHPQNVIFVDEDGDTLNCQDGPATPQNARWVDEDDEDADTVKFQDGPASPWTGPSSCRKVPRALPQVPGMYNPPLPSLLIAQAVASAPPVVTAQSPQPSFSSWKKIGMAAAAGVAAFALGFATRWMMS